ncbi:probable S-adenosylmethionine-dependent methyltransferase At5g38780 isoform X2 [Pecten maximus]|nr:probable S-adenosylmethionine-dependent methyltransferase At5g38780 isoform X2 [Pecten maximus]
MKMASKFSVDADDMCTVHGHAGNLSRASVLEGIRKITRSRSACQRKQLVTIADFGTADGRGSLSLINEVIDIIRTDLGKEQAIVVYYNDQPMNDFNLLSKIIGGFEQKSSLSAAENIYPVMVPRSMYEQCLPDSSIDLAVSSGATHYLSKHVCQIQNGVFMGEANTHEQELMREQGKADWRNFVIARGRELKPGGVLVTINASLDGENNVSSQIDKGFQHFGSFVTDMAREGVLTQEEYLAINFPSHYMRTTVDFKEPFTSTVPEVKELGLEMVSITPRKHYLEHPLYDVVRKDDTEKLNYAKRIVAMVYPWFHHAIHGGLSDSRTEDEKQFIIEEYFQRLQEYASAHSDHKPFLTSTEVVIRKRSNIVLTQA